MENKNIDKIICARCKKPSWKINHIMPNLRTGLTRISKLCKSCRAELVIRRTKRK